VGHQPRRAHRLHARARTSAGCGGAHRRAGTASRRAAFPRIVPPSSRPPAAVVAASPGCSLASAAG